MFMSLKSKGPGPGSEKQTTRLKRLNPRILTEADGFPFLGSRDISECKKCRKGGLPKMCCVRFRNCVRTLRGDANVLWRMEA